MKKYIPLKFLWWPLTVLLLLGGCSAGLTLGGCAAIQAINPTTVIDALDNAINTACGAVPTAASLEAVLASDGIGSPTAAQITMVAAQICAVLVPPKTVSARTLGAPSAPVILGYVNGVPIYGYWTK